MKRKAFLALLLAIVIADIGIVSHAIAFKNAYSPEGGEYCCCLYFSYNEVEECDLSCGIENPLTQNGRLGCFKDWCPYPEDPGDWEYSYFLGGRCGFNGDHPVAATCYWIDGEEMTYTAGYCPTLPSK